MTIMRRLPCPPDRLGEGPVWNQAAGRIEWIDVLGQTESSCMPDGSDLVRKAWPGEPAGFAYRESGGRIISSHYRLVLRDGNGVENVLPVPPFDTAREWFNDCACDSCGRCWVGSRGAEFRSHAGARYRVDTDHYLRRKV